MDFVVVRAETSSIADAPFFGATVAEAGSAATAAFAAAAGARLVAAPEGPAALNGLPRGARGLLLPGGLVSLPTEQLQELVGRAAPAPLRLENDRSQVIAVAGAAADLAPALRPTFESCLDALEPAPALGGTVRRCSRVANAAGWSAAVREAQRCTAEGFLAGGVLVEDPDSLWADPSCRAEPGARIGASVHLEGDTTIGEGARIGSFCRLKNAEIGAGAKVLSHSVILDSSIGREARVGPFALLRPDTRLEPGSLAGSFVETKNAVLGRQASLSHLSYLGDAEVGARANLGAGTITCNYDGRAKHRTVVEPGAFVGSNALLVAPVTIGRRAFVAGGSVIVKDVPAGALVIARGRQVVKPGRAAGRFEGADEI